ncbi:MAG: dihydroorotate dehydrogenase [Microthrixaceae bacterium]|nr:dihydroorotate dehydrogenase [Microthrixaceae bacterium]
MTLGSSPVDMTAQVGSLTLPAPVMTAAGTAGHGAELSAYVDLSSIGAVVVKSLSAEPWEGNAAPRVHQTPAGMLNSVGLQGPGIPAWIRDDLPKLTRHGARVVVSIWGRSVDDYERAARALQPAEASLTAVEINLSCPNLDGGAHLFAHDPVATTEVLSATKSLSVPRWAKLSPNTDRVTEVAAAAHQAGAEAVTLINTVMGMIIDTEHRRPLLGGGSGGLSGAAIHPVAVRTVYEVRRALPDLPLVGVGGVSDAVTAVELLLAGANAVQVGTATFADPRSVTKIIEGLRTWCEDRGVTSVRDLVSGAHHVAR